MPAQLFPLSPGVSVAGRLDRADIDALAAAGVRTIINNRPDGEDPGQLPAAEARRIAEAEPFFAQGLRTFELREWTVMEGTLGVRVNLSDQTVEVA